LTKRLAYVDGYAGDSAQNQLDNIWETFDECCPLDPEGENWTPSPQHLDMAEESEDIIEKVSE
jgi:hypothetical protein